MAATKNLNCSEQIVLENKMAKLESLNNSHLNLLLPIAENTPNLLKYSPCAFGNKQNLETYIQTAIEAKKQNVRYAFAIYNKADKVYAGSSSFGNISNIDKRVEIGWTWLAPQFQGTGLNKQCKYLMLQYAFDHLNFERVELKTDSRNEQSKRAMEKIGATYEGTLRSHTLMLDGYRRHTAYYSILKPEWTLLKTSTFKNMDQFAL